MERDLGDILDRLSIAKLKSERIGNEENHNEYNAFFSEFLEKEKLYENINLKLYFNMIYDINRFIWDLESSLKSGKEKLINPSYIFDEKNKESLIIIGISTIFIRNFNHLRVSFKNIVNNMVKEGFQDIKKNHISE